MSFGSIAPNQTLYINNLNEKLKKTGPTAAFSVLFLSPQNRQGVWYVQWWRLNLCLYCHFAELKRNLYLLFCQYGNVLEIHCAKTPNMRGQAWIIFDSLSSANRALRELEGASFFGKTMVLLRRCFGSVVWCC